MTTNGNPTPVYFTTTRNGGRRAFRYETRQLRAFPISVAEAELRIATGTAVEIPGNPFPRNPR